MGTRWLLVTEISHDSGLDSRDSGMMGKWMGWRSLEVKLMRCRGRGGGAVRGKSPVGLLGFQWVQSGGH